MVGRRALAAVECGRISQRELEITLADLLGAGDRGLLARAPADLRPRDPVRGLVARVRARGIPAAAHEVTATITSRSAAKVMLWPRPAGKPVA